MRKLAAVLIVLLLPFGCVKQSGFPPIETHMYASPAKAMVAAYAASATIPGSRVYVSGSTASMYPVIQPGWYLVCKKLPWDELKQYEVHNYRPNWFLRNLVCHRAVMKDGNGWIMSGDDNAHSEPTEPMTQAKYDSTVIAIYGFYEKQ